MDSYFFKLVPDDEPNADGFWVHTEIPTGSPIWDLTPITGYHVVAAQKRFPDPAPVEEYVFDVSWLPTNLKGQ